MKKILLLLLTAVAAAAVWFAAMLFMPKDNGKPYLLSVGKGQPFAAVAKQLADNGVIFQAQVFQAAARFSGVHARLHAGNYKIPAKISAWDLLAHLQKRPETTRVRIIEGMKFAQMRQVINENPDLRHDTADWSDEKLLKTIAADAPAVLPEGLFFPDSYEADQGSSDLQIYQAAYRTMQKQLAQAWDGRQAGLPYKNPYELLIMASIVEKETAHPDDRRHVAAVFRNRLHKNMRLQTDPTVIYGMGAAYQGNIRRSDLERDTPYNTYTRAGLTPTPIALPGKAALEAAANPSDADYIYFVAKMDGSGKSQFSRTLDEHNAAVRKYILKK